MTTPGDLTPAVSDRVHYWVDRRVAEERARIVAWLRSVSVEGGLKISPQDFDDLRSDWVDAQDGPNICDGDPWDASLRAAADAIERGEHVLPMVSDSASRQPLPGSRPAR